MTLSDTPLRALILGAAGRDFHDYLTFFRHSRAFTVVAFTATQIPYIEQRRFPAELAGPLHPEGIPIYPETELEALIERLRIDFVFLAYSDLDDLAVMHLAARAQAHGAAFAMLGGRQTQLPATLPVIAVTATRTGAGKSPLCQWLAVRFARQGIRAGVLRHPMPYGDLNRQRVQRFASPADLDAADCTIEEREEYAPYIEAGLVIHAGVDYAAILAAAEQESDLILWDGGNNDVSFIRPDLLLCVADALRPGHETSYYPAETNIRAADIVLINKVDEAARADVDAMHARIAAINPGAVIIETSFAPALERPLDLRGKRALVIEDSPTITHGGMPFGAGLVAARRAGLELPVDPRPYAVGSIADAFLAFAHIGPVLPALGYSPAQRTDLAESIRRCDAEVIVDASPAGIAHVYQGAVPIVRVTYPFAQRRGTDLGDMINAFLLRCGLHPAVDGAR